MTLRFTLFILTVLLGATSVAQDNAVNITDADLVENGTYTWSNDSIYILDGLVYLETGGTLNIEAGTVIQGRPATGDGGISTGDNASALIISRGAQIFARGEADRPIVFTALGDDISDNSDFTVLDRSQWGGLIVLGDAPIGFSAAENGIEGIASNVQKARYGGSNPEDNSGVLRYVSIRHGGFSLTGGDEINGLTLGGVGSGTEIDYVEVFANSDDGIEWFGGTVNVRHAVVAFCGDDAMDYDLGWRGKGQFWLAIQETSNPAGTGRSGEHDGASPDAASPFSQPTIYNATYIGIGSDGAVEDGDAFTSPNPTSVLFRDNAGGYYYNSLFTGFNNAAIQIEQRDDDTPDAYDRFIAGDLALKNNLFEDFGVGDDDDDALNPDSLFQVVNPDEIKIAAASAVFADSMEMFNEIGSSGIAGISREPDGGLDPRINAEGGALTGAEPSDDEFFSQVTYRGAFGNSANWLLGWTALDQNGYVGDLVTPVDNSSDNCINITDADLVGGETYDWTSANCYNLDGLVYLEPDATLNIGAGTVIRGLDVNRISTGDNASALIITRGATINATGTAEAPIIFTAADDDITDPDDFTSEDRGEWGGLIVLGSAPIAFSAAENGVEGIASNEERARYGGSDPEDNSGTLRYVSIRHGGFALSAGNEINGLTLGGVGSGTTIDYVEVFANLDDGIEWFGGTVKVNHAAVSYCGDDGMDYDLGWRGGGQYWFVLQGPDDPRGTGRSGEHDGASPDGATPFSQPTIYNATYIGIGNGETTGTGDAVESPNPVSVLMRDNAGGYYINSIFTDFNGAAIGIEQRDDDLPDSYDRLVAGDLAFRNNYFFNFGAGTEPTDLFLALDPDEEILMAATQVVADSFMANGNIIGDPEINSIDNRDEVGGNIDPRPFAFGPAATGAVDAEDGFEDTDYFGAFEVANGPSGNQSWLSAWTALSEQMFVDNLPSSVSTQQRAGYLLDSPVPNPASGVTRVEFELPRSGEVAITVLDLFGRPLARRTRTYPAGEQSETIDVQQLPNGTYLIVLDAQGNRLVQKLIVRH